MSVASLSVGSVSRVLNAAIKAWLNFSRCRFQQKRILLIFLKKKKMMMMTVVVLFFGSRSKTSNLRNADSDKVGVSQFWCLVGKDPGFESTPWSILIATKQAEATKFLVFF